VVYLVRKIQHLARDRRNHFTRIKQAGLNRGDREIVAEHFDLFPNHFCADRFDFGDFSGRFRDDAGDGR
jgi:hypothetical protein